MGLKFVFTFLFLPLILWHMNRVMAIAFGSSEDALVFGGLVGIMDPPRPSAVKFAETMQVGMST